FDAAGFEEVATGAAGFSALLAVTAAAGGAPFTGFRATPFGVDPFLSAAAGTGFFAPSFAMGRCSDRGERDATPGGPSDEFRRFRPAGGHSRERRATRRERAEGHGVWPAGCRPARARDPRRRPN